MGPPRTLRVRDGATSQTAYLTQPTSRRISVVGYPFHCQDRRLASCHLVACTTRGSYAELRACFPDDEACMDYLDWLRWPSGPVCPACGRTASAAVASGRVWRCGACTKQVSRTAGTIFQDTRTPLVRGRLVHDRRSRWSLGADDAEAARVGLLPDGVGDAAPLPYRDGPSRPGAADRAGRGRRDVPGRGAARPSWTWRAGQDTGGHRGGVAGAEGLRPSPDERHPRRIRRDPAAVPAGHRRAGHHCGDRRLVGLPERLPGLVPARAAPGGRVRIPGPRTASGRAPGGLTVQAVAAGHPPRRPAARAHAGLPGRVLLPAHAVRRRCTAADLPADGGQPAAEGHQAGRRPGPEVTARNTRAAAAGPALEDDHRPGLTGSLAGQDAW